MLSLFKILKEDCYCDNSEYIFQCLGSSKGEQKLVKLNWVQGQLYKKLTLAWHIHFLFILSFSILVSFELSLQSSSWALYPKCATFQIFLFLEKYPKKRWNAEEKSAAHKAFAVYFKNRKLPSKKVILEEKRRHNGLKNRSHEMIKAWISNQFKKKG